MKVRGKVSVKGNQKAVFDYLADYRNEAKWNKQIDEVKKLTDGQVGRLTKFVIVRKGHELPVQITHYERPHTLTVLIEDEALDIHDRYFFEPNKDDRVIVRQETEIQTYLIIRLFFLVIAPINYFMCWNTLRNFKKSFEAQNT